VRKGRLGPRGSEHHEENAWDAAKVNRRQLCEAAAGEEEEEAVLREAIPSRAAGSGAQRKQPCGAGARPPAASICTSQREVPGDPTELHAERITQ